MKVLHIEAGRHLYGGARQVRYLIDGLAAEGVTSVLACPPGAHLGNDIEAAVTRHVTVRRIALHGDADVLAWTRLTRLMREVQPDLVHVHSRRGADWWGGLAANSAGIPAIISRRVDNPEPRWLARRKYARYARIIAISEGIAAVLTSAGIARDKLVCVRSALDAGPPPEPDRTAFRQHLGLPANAPLIAMVAQLIPRKGHRHLMAALPRVLERHPDTRVLIYGRGPLAKPLAAEIAASPFAGQVRLMGFVDDVRQHLPNIDVLAHPADMEGLGIALLQAAAAQVPVVACRAGGMPEAVADGETGVLITPGDVAGLAGALIRLLDDAALRQRMGMAGRARMLREFSPAAMVAGNLAVYRRVLAENALRKS